MRTAKFDPKGRDDRSVRGTTDEKEQQNLIPKDETIGASLGPPNLVNTRFDPVKHDEKEGFTGPNEKERQVRTPRETPLLDEEKVL